MFDDVDILVDLQTGAVSVVVRAAVEGEADVELETVVADDEFAPQE